MKSFALVSAMAAGAAATVRNPGPPALTYTR